MSAARNREAQFHTATLRSPGKLPNLLRTSTQWKRIFDLDAGKTVTGRHRKAEFEFIKNRKVLREKKLKHIRENRYGLFRG